ncbi:MAG: hybrid sensor histidine kinase/response regulator [Massilia sp.]|nr:hybrid sensor histidine kinase/response regulator [Massilia sp.]
MISTKDEERILILSPWGRDGEVMRAALQREGFNCDLLADFDTLALRIRAGAGAALVTEEALHQVDLRALGTFLAEQESWSDFPFVVLVSKRVSHDSLPARNALSELGNVILLERPLNARTLHSAMASVMRGRRRQYQARDVLADRTRTAERLSRSQAELMRLNETLEAHISSRTRELAQANDRLTNEMFERERVQQAMVQLQKMEAVGRLTGGIAHDFNNLLNVVQGSMDLILMLSSDEGARRRAEVARRACERGAKLTSQLLAFSRNQTLNLRPVGVAAIFDGVRELVAASLGSRVAVSFKVEPTARHVFADANQMEMALLNLAINARDAMPEGGQLRFSASVTAPPAGLLRAGEYVRFAVTDTGTGMTAEVASRVFEPFFTTKEVGQGTGLGLSQVYGMAVQSGGAARVVSEPGQGATVEIWLPCAHAPEQADRADDALASRPHAGARLLLVEDDDSVRQLMAESLEAIGYTVTQAADGESALIMLRQARPDLLITDYLMPGMTGAELMQKVRVQAPDLPMIIATGYADMKAIEEVIGENQLLRKPFPLAELAATVARALETEAH